MDFRWNYCDQKCVFALNWPLKWALVVILRDLLFKKNKKHNGMHDSHRYPWNLWLSMFAKQILKYCSKPGFFAFLTIKIIYFRQNIWNHLLHLASQRNHHFLLIILRAESLFLKNFLYRCDIKSVRVILLWHFLLIWALTLQH